MKRFISKKQYFLFLTLMLLCTSPILSHKYCQVTVLSPEKQSLYTQLNLSAIGLKQDIFDKALVGWNILLKNHQISNLGLLSIVDLSQSSKLKRLYVIDIDKKVVLFNTYVAHGRNSGGEFAEKFANKLNSFKSSLGFYVTGPTYKGAHGMSMRLKGIEKGINDGAEQRGIVMHGAVYVSESFIKSCGRLGRSEGCPAVPESICQSIISYIKNGSCFFMYYPDTLYIKNSKLT